MSAQLGTIPRDLAVGDRVVVALGNDGWITQARKVRGAVNRKTVATVTEHAKRSGGYLLTLTTADGDSARFVTPSNARFLRAES